ncbi:MAG: carboxypeptidase-like regulatory domain-containing protein [Candidatus Nanopelagicales bacterium]
MNGKIVTGALFASLVVAGAAHATVTGTSGEPQKDPEYLSDAARRAAPPKQQRIAAAVVASGSVTGTVTAQGTVVPGAFVELYTATGNFMNDTVTNAAGAYSIGPIQAGPYKVRVTPPAGRTDRAATWVGGRGLLSARQLDVTGEPVTADADIPAAVSVRGLVQHAPGAGSAVRVCGESYLDCRLGAVGADGGFRIVGAPAGDVSIALLPKGHGLPLVFPKTPPRPTVTLVADRTTRIEIDAASQVAPIVTYRALPDTTPPVITSARLTWPRGVRFVTVRAKDEATGVNRMQLRVGGVNQTTRAFQLAPIRVPGTATVRVRVRDGAGNWSGWVTATGQPPAAAKGAGR